MKLTIEVREEKAEFMLELLRSFSFVKLEKVSAEKIKMIQDLKTAVHEVKRERRSEISFKTAQQMLDEL